jgi:hypothetical protein
VRDLKASAWIVPAIHAMWVRAGDPTTHAPPGYALDTVEILCNLGRNIAIAGALAKAWADGDMCGYAEGYADGCRDMS